MTKITVVSYCHAAHKKWIPFWAEQISRQEFQDFEMLFIAHNWGEESPEQAYENLQEFSMMLKDSPVWNLPHLVRFESYWSPPVIGDVIDEAGSIIETEYLAHWDVDDIIHPKRLLLQSQYLDAHPETDFLGTRMVGFTGEPEPEMLELNYIQPNEPNLDATEHDAIKHCLLSKGQNCLGHTTMIYKPRVLRMLGGFSRSDVKTDGKSPDFETWKKALMAGYKFHRLPQLCALWRLDSSSIRS